MKKIIIIIFPLIFTSCLRADLNSINNCVIIKQHCEWDNLDGGYYTVKDLSTGQIKRINVDIQDCDIYNVGDTLK